MRRLQVVLGHLKDRPDSGPEPAPRAAPCWSSARPSAADDVVVVHGRRTAIGRAGRGGFKDTTPDELLSAVMTALLQDVKLSPAQLGDICVGNVLQPGAGAVMARIAQFLSDIPETVPLSTVNRQCSSGLQAVASIAGGIRNGSYDIGMACGVESMSLADRGNPGNITSRLMEKEKARDCLIPMGDSGEGLDAAPAPSLGPQEFSGLACRSHPEGLNHTRDDGSCTPKLWRPRKLRKGEAFDSRTCWITSENVAEKFGISREKQDTFALASQQKAARAQSKGCFQAEIVPVTTTVHDDKGTERSIIVAQDEGIRPNTTMEGLAKLKPAFKKGGSTTAGNSSQVSDGAAAILLARRSKAEELGLPILGVLRSYAVVGVPPDIMGIGPAYAIPVALQKAGLTVNDVDIFEINEAFASQAVYCVEKLGLPPEKVNPLGGAVALGHPLGCTGARQVITLLNELKRRGKRAYGVVSMCIGTGMGAAAVFEYPGN
ncbi:3-ketoacyl-CoA thiolase, peroxisomal isoform X1 [Diceros bicornis minor]|uniref:3-ketoacyl-CoA thiolase, peroxisomal isoform X1 n=1 Tax=Diceros bicornis minor TaxID=77932 RepID=UPI0026F33E2C|nr:3-ketoacyl-CoA thiolase, peroxisomal isoform X1 [Diceros bicornis minor]